MKNHILLQLRKRQHCWFNTGHLNSRFFFFNWAFLPAELSPWCQTGDGCISLVLAGFCGHGNKCRQETEISQRLCDTWAVYVKVNHNTILHCSCIAELSNTVSCTAAKSTTSSAVSKLQFPTGATARWICRGTSEAEGDPASALRDSNANSNTA